MSIVKRRYLIPFALLALFLGPNVAASQLRIREPRTDVRTFAESYCKAEFEGSRDFLVTNSIWSRQAENRFKIFSDLELGAFDVLSDPMRVVTSYRIDKIENNGPIIEIFIHYNEVAHTRGWGQTRELLFSKSDNVLVLRVKSAGNSFKIIDPPAPRVSLDAVIDRMDESYSRLYRLNGSSVDYLFPNDSPKESPGNLYLKRCIHYLLMLKKIKSDSTE